MRENVQSKEIEHLIVEWVSQTHIYHCTYDAQVYSNERIHKSGERDFNIFYVVYFYEICTEENTSCINIHAEQRYET